LEEEARQKIGTEGSKGFFPRAPEKCEMVLPVHCLLIPLQAARIMSSKALVDFLTSVSGPVILI
jgi:hypothetical protein